MYPVLQYDKNRVDDIDSSGNDHGYDRDRYFFMSRPITLKEDIYKPENPIREMLKRKINGSDYHTNGEDEDYE